MKKLIVLLIIIGIFFPSSIKAETKPIRITEIKEGNNILSIIYRYEYNDEICHVAISKVISGNSIAISCFPIEIDDCKDESNIYSPKIEKQSYKKGRSGKRLLLMMNALRHY